jgi:hypothetical protein
MATSPNTSATLPFSQELSIPQDAHGDLRTVMLDLAGTTLSSPDTIHQWHIRGIPIRSAALIGRPEQLRKIEYHYMDMLMSSHPNADEPPECAISFHGHALDYSMEVLLDPSDRFSIHPEYGRSKYGTAVNHETHSGSDKHEILTFLFKLLGNKGIPETVQHPDSPDFDTKHALETVMAQISATGVASKETTSDYVTGLSFVLDDANFQPVEAIFARTRQERPAASETLRLVARTAVEVWSGIKIRKQLTYEFQTGDIIDGDSTSARLYLSPVSPTSNLDPIEVQQMVQNTLRATEESFSRELMNAARIIPPHDSRYTRIAS